MEEDGVSVATGCRENVRVALVYFPENMNTFYEGSDVRVGVYILSKKMCNKVEENGESVVTGCRENV